MKSFHWYKIADEEAEIGFADNNIAVVEVKGKAICLGKWKDEIFAFAYTCPHAGALLAEGRIDMMGNVVCPLHHYKYNISNGRNVSGEGYYLRHWPVEAREAGIFVGLEDAIII